MEYNNSKNDIIKTNEPKDLLSSFHKKNNPIIDKSTFQVSGENFYADKETNRVNINKIASSSNLASLESPYSARNLVNQNKENERKTLNISNRSYQMQDLNIIPEARVKEENQISFLKPKSGLSSLNDSNNSSLYCKDSVRNMHPNLRNSQYALTPSAKLLTSVAQTNNALSAKNLDPPNNSNSTAIVKKSGFTHLIMDLLAMGRNKNPDHCPINRMQLEILQDKAVDFGIARTFDENSKRKTNIFVSLQKAKKNKRHGFYRKFKNCIRCKKRKKRKKVNISLKETILKNWEDIKAYYKKKWKVITFILKPNSRFRIFWDIISMILINYQLLIVPLQLSFDYDQPYGLYQFDLFVDLFFMCDIILSFNTAYIDDKSGLITNRKQIAINYIKSWFWIDLVSSFPYSWLDGEIIGDVTTTDNNSSKSQSTLLEKVGLVKLIRFMRFLKILRLLRVLKLSKIFDKFESFVKISMTLSGFIGFLKLSIFILYLSHWLGCAWHYLGVNQLSTSPTTWLSAFDIVNESWDVRYVSSIYWAVTTMVTIGYGDIKPITNTEKSLAIFAMIMSCCVFAFVVNRMNILIEQMEYNAFLYRSKMRSFTNQLRSREVGSEVVGKIKRYMEYYFAEQKSFNNEESRLLNLLSDSLKVELLTQIYAQIISKIPFLMENFSKSFLANLAYVVKELNCGPSEEIWTENVDDHSVYYIYAGEIIIYVKNNNKNNTQFKIITAGLHFGEIGFFTGLDRKSFAKSREYCRLFKIARHDFLDLLEAYPSDREKFYMIKDKIQLYENYEDLRILCYACKIPNHITIDCPLLHLKIDKPYMIKKYKIAQDGFCQNFPRKKLKKIKYTYHHFEKCAEKIRKIHENELENIEKLINNFTNLGLRKKKTGDVLDPNYKPYRAKLASIIARRFNIKIRVNQKADINQGSMVDKEENLDFKAKKLAIQCDIDCVTNFQVYFPHNNATTILEHQDNEENINKKKSAIPILLNEPTLLEKIEKQYDMLLSDFSKEGQENKDESSILESFSNVSEQTSKSQQRNSKKNFGTGIENIGQSQEIQNNDQFNNHIIDSKGKELNSQMPVMDENSHQCELNSDAHNAIIKEPSKKALVFGKLPDPDQSANNILCSKQENLKILGNQETYEEPLKDEQMNFKNRSNYNIADENSGINIVSKISQISDPINNIMYSDRVKFFNDNLYETKKYQKVILEKLIEKFGVNNIKSILYKLRKIEQLYFMKITKQKKKFFFLEKMCLCFMKNLYLPLFDVIMKVDEEYNSI